MLSFLARYVAPISVAVGPLFTLQYSILDLAGFVPDAKGQVELAAFQYVLLDGPKAEVELEVRAWLTGIGIAFLLLTGYFDAYAPSRTLANFRHDFLQQICREQWRKRGRLRSDIRINVMYLRWWLFLRVIWRDGFKPSDRDRGVRFTRFQGVCGKAARQKDAVFVDFRTNPHDPGTFRSRWLLGNRFRLFGWQLRQTRSLKAILSVPIFDTVGTREHEHEICVGVINLDSSTDAGADHLNAKAKEIAVFLAKYGTLIAKMR